MFAKALAHGLKGFIFSLTLITGDNAGVLHSTTVVRL
jgi:hypothetical protein